MTPWVRNTALGMVGVALLVFLLLYLAFPSQPPGLGRPGQVAGMAKAEGLSGQGIFWMVVVLATAVAVLSAYAKTKPVSKALWLLAIAVPLWWLIWGAGWSAVVQPIGVGDPTATPIKGVRQITVPLKGKNQWVAVDKLFPGCTRYTLHGPPGVENVEVRFLDGGLDTIGDGKEFGRTRYPAAFRGDGMVVVSLFSAGKDCRS